MFGSAVLKLSAARPAWVLIITAILAVSAAAQTTKFTYQGSLTAGGSPANGNYDLQFKLYDAAIGGVQQGSTVTLNSVAVTNGTFSTTLDFGSAVFSAGTDRYLEIWARQTGVGGFVALSPRMQILSSPYAVHSLGADAANTATTASNALQLGGIASSGYIQNTTTPQAATNISITGGAFFGSDVGIGTSSPAAKLHVAGQPPPVAVNGDGTNAANAMVVTAGSGGNTNGVNMVDLGGNGGGISIRGGDGGQNPTTASRDGNGGSITLQGGLTRSPAINGNVNLSPDGGNVIVAGANTGGRLGVGTTAPAARLNVVDPRVGTPNPDFNNLPPTAVLGRTTSTSESTIGVLGIADSSTGIGLAGITYGDGTTAGQSDAAGVFAAALAPTGPTIGVSVQVESPNGTAIDAHLASTGDFISANSDDGAASNPRFRVTSLGQVISQGGMWAKGFHLNSDNLNILETGNLSTTGSISSASVTTTGNVTVGGWINGAADPLRIESNMLVNGTITPMLLSGGNTQLCNLTGTTTLRFCSSSLRYKRDVSDFRSGLDIVKRLRPITFEWKENGAVDLGLAAEEVANVEPLLVTTNADGQVEGVRYAQISVVLINAMREQQAMLERQQLAIAKLTREVERLRRRPAPRSFRRRR